MNLLIGLLLSAVTATTTPSASVEKVKPAAERVPIYLQTDARDLVGSAYVLKLREALEASPAYRPVPDPMGARFIVGILTMDPNEAEVGAGPGRSTVAAVTLQRENATGLTEFVYSWVLVAKLDAVETLANELVAAIDEEIQDVERVPVVVFEEPAKGTK